MDVDEALTRLGGVARTHDLRGLGVPKRALSLAVNSGRVIRVSQGCYTLPGADPLRVAEVQWRAPTTCVTLLRQMGLPVLSADTRTHLLFTPDRNLTPPHGCPPPAAVRHFGAETPNNRLLTALDFAAACVPRVHHLVLLDAAIHRGLMAESGMTALTRGSRRRRAWLARHVDGSAESPLETIARVALRSAGLEVQPQAVVDGVGRVDLLVAGRVIVETDGRTFHADTDSFTRDRRRDRAAARLGLHVLRYTYSEVLGAPNTIVDDVQEVLRILRA